MYVFEPFIKSEFLYFFHFPFYFSFVKLTTLDNEPPEKREVIFAYIHHPNTHRKSIWFLSRMYINVCILHVTIKEKILFHLLKNLGPWNYSTSFSFHRLLLTLSHN